MVFKKEKLIEILELISKRLIESEKILTELDSEIGDGDCGSGIKRGFEAVLNILTQVTDKSINEILRKVGFTLASTIGGTSGAILGTGFMELGKSMVDKEDPTLKDWGNAATNALDSMKNRGEGTKIGDKTLIDSLEPAIIEFNRLIDKNEDIVNILQSVSATAKEGSEKTKSMIAKKGRASYLGERTVGKIDPGSVVITIIFDAVHDYFKNLN